MEYQEQRQRCTKLYLTHNPTSSEEGWVNQAPQFIVSQPNWSLWSPLYFPLTASLIPSDSLTSSDWTIWIYAFELIYNIVNM